MFKFLFGLLCVYLSFVCVCLFFMDYFPQSRITQFIKKYIIED